MKRQKGHCPKSDGFKRQKSNIGDDRLETENEVAQMREESEKTSEESQQDASNNLQQDVDGGKATRREPRSENETNDTKNEKGVNAEIAACRTPDKIKPKKSRRGVESQPGFGFTKDTVQYRPLITGTSENGKDQSCSSIRKSKKNCIEKMTNEQKKSVTENGSMPCSNRGSAGHKLPTATCSNVVFQGKTCAETSIKITDNKCKDQRAHFDLEMDVIYTCNMREKMLDHAPSLTPADFADMNPTKSPAQNTRTLLCMIPIGKQKPDYVTNIVIPHPHADRPEGDDFGAKLGTYNDDKHKPPYFRHFLIGRITGPAKDMGIRKDDELVLIGDIFVPDLKHTDVLNLFHHVQVDGKTTFSLVIRRVEDKEWKWIQTSAILTPDKLPDKGPIIKPVKYKQLKEEAGKIETATSSHLYKVPMTQKYLEISNKSVCIDVFKQDESDKNKIIMKRCRFWPSGQAGQIDFEAALCNRDKTRYIGMDKTNNHIVLKNDAVWFKIIMLGSKVRFQLKDQYIGYDKENGVVKAQQNNCEFEELPASTMQDLTNHPSGPASFPSVTDRVDGNICSQASVSVLQVLEADINGQETACISKELHIDITNQASIAGGLDEDMIRQASTAHLRGKHAPEHPLEDGEPEASSMLMDDSDSVGNSSTHSNVDSFNLSQSSNNSDKNDFDEYGRTSMETDSSGYGSAAQSPPNSLEMKICDGPNSYCVDKLRDCKKYPKTPTTPMNNLFLSGN